MTLLHDQIDAREVGMDPARLARIDDHFARYVTDGRLVGWQLAVTRNGHIVHTSTRGHSSMDSERAVESDTIWRIYSMTKPITSVAAMMLWEEGAFELKDPVSNFLPEFADVKVWRGGSAVRPDLEPLMSPIEMW